MAANKITDPGLIFVGQRLVIPPPTPTPTPTETPIPTPTPTPGLPYAAPFLLYPPDGATFTGAEADIVLNWTSVGLLADDEWYVLRLRDASDAQPSPASVWTKIPSYRLPAEWRPGPSSEREILWDVVVMRARAPVQDGVQSGTAASPMSATRRFLWKP